MFWLRNISVFRAILAALVGIALPCLSLSQEIRKITLTEAIDLALKNNHALLIASDKVAELKNATHAARSNFFPQVTTSASYLRFTQTDVLHFSPGSFGTFPGLGSLPMNELNVKQGEVNNELSQTQAAQPITQLFKIHDGYRVAKADENASRQDFLAARNQIALVVRQLYYGILTVRLEQETAAKQLQVTEEQLGESQQDVGKGSALEVALIGAKVSALQAKQRQLTAGLQRSDLEAEFKDVVGIPQVTHIEIDEQPSPLPDLPSKEECIRLAQSTAPGIRSAEEVVRKADAAVASARAEYIPDLSFFAREDYQDGVAFLYHNYGVVGFHFSYTWFDGGKRRAVLGEQEARRAQARENLERLKDEAAVNVEKALNKIEQSKSLIDVAHQAVALREEGDRLAGVRLRYSVILSSERLEAVSELAKARTDLLKAQLGYMESQAELATIIGRLPE